MTGYVAAAEPVSRSHRVTVRRRMVVVVAGLGVAVVAIFVVSMMLGSSPLSPAEVLQGLAGSGEGSTNFVVRQLRLPRSVAAVLIGLALGASGTIFQRVLGNRLASPDFLGVASGAGTAATAALVLGNAGGAALPVAAAVGAAVSATAIYALAWRRGISGYRFILVGVGVYAFMESATSYLIARADFTDARAATRWLIGSVGMASPGGIAVLAVVCAALLVAGPAVSRRLHALELGEDLARGLGSRTQLDRLVVIGCALLLVAAATSAAGPIAFVALLAGPLAGVFLGTAGASIAAAALAGALITQLADLAAQYALPWPISTGVVTGFVGAPYIVWLLVSAGRRGMA